jgi:hypothetical protein
LFPLQTMFPFILYQRRTKHNIPQDSLISQKTKHHNKGLNSNLLHLSALVTFSESLLLQVQHTM